MPGNSTNVTGHWESNVICRLNDRILASAGTKWDDWLEIDPGWFQSPKAAEFREESLVLVREEFGSSRLFVLKDPRICRLVPFWLAVLEEAGVRPLIASPVRNPLEVAASLGARNGFEAGFGQLLWLRHVLDAEFASRGMPRFFTSYDRLLGGWAGAMTEAQSTLGVAWPRMSDQAAAEIEAFLSDEYRHHKEAIDTVLENRTLSGWLRRTFAILNNWAAAGENPRGSAELDRIRTALNTAAPAFSGLLAAEREKASHLASDLGSERQRLGEAEKEISRLKCDLESRAGAARAAEQALAETRTKLAEAEAARSAEQERAKDAGTALAEACHRPEQSGSAPAQRRHDPEQTAGNRTRIFNDVMEERGIRQVCFLATSFRTGSTLLGRLLSAQTGLAFHIESFNAAPAWYSLDAQGLRRQLSLALAPECAGRFAAKLMWPHRNNLARLLQIDPCDAIRFAELFPGVRFLHLARRDKVAQAVSFHIARHSGVWDSRKIPVSAEVPYRFHEISTCYMHFLSFDQLWRQFLEALGENTETYWYEDMIDDPRATARRAAAHFGLAFDDSLYPDEPPLQKQDNPVSEAFQARFREDLHRLAPPEFLPARLIGPPSPRASS